MGATVLYEHANELVTLQNTFSVNSVATDPADVTLTVKSPTNVTTSYTYSLAQITRTATGVYKKDIPCNEAGDWEYTWVGTVTASDVVTGTWTVFPLQLGKLYSTVDALKSRLGLPATDVKDDFELHMACFTASRAVEEYCGRVFWRSASGSVRTFESMSMYHLDMPAYNDLVSVSTLKTDSSGDGTFETTWASTDYQLLWYRSANPSAYPEPRPYTRIKAVGTKTFPSGYWGDLTRTDRVQVTGVFGWPSVPLPVKQATLMLADDLFGSKESAFRVGGWNEFGRMRARKNPNVVTYCGPYRRPELDFPVRRI